MSNLGAEVNWDSSPEAAVFYANDYFRNRYGFWWNEKIGDWIDTNWSIEELHAAKDYQKRPEALTKPDTPVSSEASTKAEPKDSVNASEWTSRHYDNYYHLSEKDIKEGKVKVDAYFVNKLWSLNSKDDTGALFHCLKTIARFGDKNPVERELNALYNQVKRMAELYGVTLK